MSEIMSPLGQRKGERPVFSIATANIIKAMYTFNLTRYIMITGLTLDTNTDKKGIRTRLLSFIMRLSFPSIITDKKKEYMLTNGIGWKIKD